MSKVARQAQISKVKLMACIRLTQRTNQSTRFVNGFSYLWLLFTIALLSTGLALAAEIFTTASKRDKEKELLAIGRQFRVAFASYYEAKRAPDLGAATAVQPVQLPPNSKPGPNIDLRQYPTTLDALLKDDRFPGIKRHLRKVFTDPMTGQAEWGLVQQNGKITGVHSLSEQEPIKIGGFEPDDSSFEGAKKYSEWKFTYPADLLLLGLGSSPIASTPALITTPTRLDNASVTSTTSTPTTNRTAN